MKPLHFVFKATATVKGKGGKWNSRDHFKIQIQILNKRSLLKQVICHANFDITEFTHSGVFNLTNTSGKKPAQSQVGKT